MGKSITNAWLFDQLIHRTYGRLTVDTQLFRSIGRTICPIPKTFFYDRAIGHANLPINDLAAERVILLYELALRGKTRYRPSIVSDRLVQILEEASGLSLNALRDSSEVKSDEKRIAVMIECLQSLLLSVAGKEAIEVNEVRIALNKVLLSNREQAIGPSHEYGCNVRQFYFRVNDIGFDTRILTTERNLDVVHIHGLSWTNSNREFLTDLMRKPDVTIRVCLLDPEGPFFRPYADFIGIGAEAMRSKVNEAISIWATIREMVVNDQELPCSLFVGIASFFPAKSIYRFDNSCVIVPNNNSQPKGQFMAYDCIDDGSDSKDAHSIYVKELDWLFNHTQWLIK